MQEVAKYGGEWCMLWHNTSVRETCSENKVLMDQIYALLADIGGVSHEK